MDFRKTAGTMLALAAMLAGSTALAAPSASPVWSDRTLTPEARAAALLAAMTEADKFQQLVGGPGVVPELPACLGARHVPGLPRLAIPTFRITNGPVGVGQNDCVPADPPGRSGMALLLSMDSARATALPSAITLAASFDETLAASFGDLLGRESRALALHVVEAPGINLARAPQAGRNFEYFGEDPYLSGTMAVAEVKAIQAQGVIAMPKHFVANEQETDRMRMNAIIDDRVLHELYLLPFEMAVKDGGAASVMCSYNSVNGSQMCENRHLLTDVLRGQWGFTGYVQSDFFAVRGLAALKAGMDHEMPGLRTASPALRTWFTPENLRAALDRGEITQADIDTALSRRYVQMFRLGIFDRPLVQTPLDARADAAVAARIGEQGAVLLKNTGGLLPLDAHAIRHIVLVGKADYADRAVVGGGGSSQVIPFGTVTPLAGFQETLAALRSRATVSLVLVADNNGDLDKAVAAARAADAVVVLAGSLASEGADRPDLRLPKGQDTMIEALLAANPRTAVVLKDNSAVLMPWIADAPAVLETWFPGQEDGRIVSRLLLGLANPSGKTPVTYPVRAEDLAVHAAARFPGIDGPDLRRVDYSEGLQIGYRWFDAQGIKPLFPFGHGLSYTTFRLDGFSVAPVRETRAGPVKVSLVIANTGYRAGAETAEVYLSLPAATGEPPRRLVAFRKVWLAPGQSRRIEITLDPAATNHPFGVFEPETQSWRIAPGDYRVMIGVSSQDIRYVQTVSIPS